MAVYRLIEEVPQISRQEMAKKLEVSLRTIDRTIQSLTKKEHIKREGSRKTGASRAPQETMHENHAINSGKSG